MAAQRTFKSSGGSAGHDGPTLPPAKGEMDELLDVCGRTPSATMKIHKSELDSLKMLAVSVAVPPDAFDEINARHRHLRVAPPSLPRMRSAEDGSVRNITVVAKPIKKKRSPSAMEMAKTLAAGAPAPMQRLPSEVRERAKLRMRPAMMWLPALAVTFGIGAFATMSGGSRATASTTEPVTIAAGAAAAASGAAVPSRAEPTSALQTDDGTANVNAVRRALPAGASPAGAAAQANANIADVLSPLYATGAPPVNPDDSTSCESGADVGARAAAKGDFEAAEVAYARVLECNPHYLPARIGRADAAWDRGAHVRASLQYKQLVDDLEPTMYPQRVGLRALPQEPTTAPAPASAPEAPASAPVGTNE